MVDLKKLSAKELKKLADETRELLIKVISKNGGHLASNLGVVELTIAIHRVFNSPKDKIIFDVGHQSYVHKILTGRKTAFPTIRKRNGLGPFTDPKESIHDAFISGHAGTGISAACGIAPTCSENMVVVVIGDASVCNGHSLEALNNMSEGSTNIVVILNDNNMSIGKNVGTLSRFLGKVMTSSSYRMLRKDVRKFVDNGVIGKRITRTLEKVENSVKQLFSPLTIFELFGFKFYGAIDGHNISELEECFKKLKPTEGPYLIHVKTQKGKGYSYAEEDAEKFHGISSFDLQTGEANSSKETYSKVFSNKICELAEKDESIHCISAAMVKGVGLDEFSLRFPNRLKDVGIAEGHGVTYSAGLAISGEKPYVAMYSTFLQRAFSQIIHDVSLQNLPVKFIVDRAGIVGEDGKTHHGLYDIGMFLTIPNFYVFAPTTGLELEEILEATANLKDKSVAIRYPRESVFNFELPSKFEIGKWQEVKQSKKDKKLVIATGSMFQEIMSIEAQLENCTIVSAASIYPLDTDYIKNNFMKYEQIYILEEAYKVNSFGSSIINYLNEINLNKKVNVIALETGCIPHGTRDELMREFGMRGQGLVDRIKKY